MRLLTKLQSEVSIARRLISGGASISSVIRFPLLRRSKHPRAEIALRNGLTIVAPAEVELLALFDEIWVERCYAPEPIALERGDAVIDIGANVGVFTLWAAAEFPQARIIALEPAAPTFEVLRENVSRNALNQVEMMRAACAGQGGSALLQSRGPASMNTLYRSDVLGSSFCELENVRKITLDEVLAKFNIERVGLLKLDCEGAEYEILLNASDATLRRIKRIAMEYHLGLNTGTPAELGEFLANKGYEVRILPPRSEEDGYMYAKNVGQSSRSPRPASHSFDITVLSSREAMESVQSDEPARVRLRRFLRNVPQLQETVYLLKSLRHFRSSEAAAANFGDYSAREDLWGYSTTWGKQHLAVLEQMLDRAAGSARFRLGFEVGCGEGYVSETVARRCDSLLATDVSSVALERARERCKSLPQVGFAKWNLLSDPLPGQYNLILLMGVIECFDRRRDFILARDKIVQMLEPGGLLLTTTTQQHEIFDTAWWTKWLPRGTKRTAEFIAHNPALVMLDMAETPTHQFVTFRKK